VCQSARAPTLECVNGWLPWAAESFDPATALQVPAWHSEAACRDVPDPDIFFPKRGGSSQEARAICTRCPMLDECLKWTLETRPEYGIFGNTSERERRALKREDVA
jgi:WhiB family transcriptional regulator, redox-sensing transcriptional regulator